MKYSKTNATLLSLFLIFLVAFPVIENWRPEPKDSFPLSYYPMFSLKRNKSYTLRHFIGYDENENRYLIPYQYIGSGGLNQVRRQMNKMWREGKEDKLMRKVVENIKSRPSSKFKKVNRVAFVKATYNLEDYFIRDIHLPRKESILKQSSVNDSEVSWFQRLKKGNWKEQVKTNK